MGQMTVAPLEAGPVRSYLSGCQEEAGSAISPLTFLLVGTYIVAQAAAETPLGAVLAYVPLTSPLLVPIRLAVGVAGPGS